MTTPSGTADAVNDEHALPLDPWPGDGDGDEPVVRPGSAPHKDPLPTSDITAIDDDPAVKQRQLVHLDDRQALSVHRKTLKELGLAAGQTWNRRDLARQCRELEYSHALDAAIALLSQRARSLADLGRRLRRKGYSSSAVGAVVTKLSDLGLINDERFAEDLMDSLQRRENLGQRAIFDRMRREGLPQTVVARVTEERTDEDREAARALELARKRLSRMTDVDPMKARRRVYAFLIRRGFAARHAAAALQQASEAVAESEFPTDEADGWD
jgi:regulatory protein